MESKKAVLEACQDCDSAGKEICVGVKRVAGMSDHCENRQGKAMGRMVQRRYYRTG